MKYEIYFEIFGKKHSLFAISTVRLHYEILSTANHISLYLRWLSNNRYWLSYYDVNEPTVSPTGGLHLMPQKWLPSKVIFSSFFLEFPLTNNIEIMESLRWNLSWISPSRIRPVLISDLDRSDKLAVHLLTMSVKPMPKPGSLWSSSGL